MKIINIKTLLVVTVLAISSCKKNDYIKGGERTDINQYKGLTTYEMLKKLPLYDTLIMVIDSAGLKDQINAENTTFYAPSDQAILNYLAARTVAVQKINQYAKFALDSLMYYLKTNKNNTRDSLLMYRVNQRLDYNALRAIGAVGTKFPTGLAGDSVVISFEATRDANQGYNDILSTEPQLQYFTQMWKPYTLNTANPANKITSSIGVRTICKTSFITTKTGYVTALDNASHTFLFWGTKVN